VIQESAFVWSDGSFNYNTLTRTKSKLELPVFSNKDAVRDVLLAKPKRLQLTFIPTWSCNLRCPHCFVLKKLDRDFKSQPVDISRIKSFITWHHKEFSHKEITGLVIGGEPLLYEDICHQYVDLMNEYGAFCSLTTNLSVPLTDSMLNLFRKLSQAQISIDGPETLHNESRRVYLQMANPTPKDTNVFRQVVENLKLLKHHGLNKKLHVAVSIRKDQDHTKEVRELKLILKALEVGDTTIGYIAESSYFNKSKDQKITAMRAVAKPCCSYRYMQHFVVQGQELYADYFDKTGKSHLGNVYDDFNLLPKKYASYIEAEMPALNDPACLSCPALPICWGQCAGHTLFENFVPSKFCDQNFMINKLKEHLQNPTYLESFTADAEQS
jgi:radical SAM protein with 4Fe4S-binding SPASM domain